MKIAEQTSDYGEKIIYLDNAAATPLSPEVVRYISEQAPTLCGNQEAIHGVGYRLRQLMQSAAGELINLVCNNQPSDDTALFWGESGTQLLNTFFSLPLFRQGNIITTALEHPALLAAASRTGAEIRYVKTPHGKIDMEHLAALLDENTILVALHQVQSEIGIMQNLPTVRELLRAYNSSALLLVDTVQAAGKLPIPWQEAAIDCCLVSGHKFGAMGGGLIYRNHFIPGKGRIADYLHKMRSQHYLLSRPEPLHALSLAYSLRLCYRQMAKRYKTITTLSHWLREALRQLRLPGGKRPIITVPEEDSSAYIIHLLLPGCQGAVVVRMLAEHNIAVSAGTACAAETANPGKTMTAIGYSQHSYATLRISLWHDTTLPMLEHFVATLQQVLDNY